MRRHGLSPTERRPEELSQRLPERCGHDHLPALHRCYVLITYAQDAGKLVLGAAVGPTKVAKDFAKLLAVGGNGIDYAGWRVVHDTRPLTFRLHYEHKALRRANSRAGGVKTVIWMVGQALVTVTRCRSLPRARPGENT